MKASAPRRCPACGGNGRQIVIIDKGTRWQEYLEYTVPDAESSGWSSQLPVQGYVASVMCEGCGLILLYGIDYEDVKKRRADAEANRGRLSVSEGDPRGQLSSVEAPGTLSEVRGGALPPADED